MSNQEKIVDNILELPPIPRINPDVDCCANCDSEDFVTIDKRMPQDKTKPTIWVGSVILSCADCGATIKKVSF